ncbi:metallophosphoesterase [Faecalibacillus faecis]|uniref:metallophosphoesterase n=1 Tax=Faecalibacillus faecis TaxID=1982628 RepID=UPI0022E950CA|nr:metallophosphoesterase [Faecalibacillus faecis]
MHYVMSDLHGEYEKYKEMLSLINFKDEDVLYVLGDVVDRGKHPLRIIQDMMRRPNVIPLIGNHDYMCLISLYYLMKEINDTNIQQFEDENHLEIIRLWIEDGGQPTLEEFMTLSKTDREEIIDYLGEFNLYEEVCVNNRDFVLVHA